MRTLILAACAAALATGVSAQTHLPTHRAAPAVTASAPTPRPAKPAVALSPEKAAVSKACSEQADAKKLKGKARKKFRSACKHHGGKG